MAGNLFANVQQKILRKSEQERVGIAVNALQTILNEVEDTKFLFSTMVIGARMGVNGTGVSAMKERIFIRTVFNRIAKGAPENMIDLCLIPADEEVYECIETMLRFGPTVALPLLDYILAVAYSDDILETYLEQKLESMFAPLLLVAFFKSGEESVPSPSVSVKLTDLESKILKWFREDGDTHTLKDAQKKFSFKSGSEVQHALDSLCDKGILYGGANMIGHTYFLNHDALDDEDDEETELDDGVLEAFSELDKEMTALQEDLEDAGIEVYPSGIGDTGFDAYNWTFTKNTRADGGSWTIAIPDGFVITDSQENRVFEAIPEDCTETEPEEARVRILPGAEQDLADHLLAHHPSAQKGLFTSVAALGAERSAEMFGEVPKHFLLSYENTYASVLIYNTGGGSYSYQCTVYDCKKSIMLRVQTQDVTDEQEKQLHQSIQAWLKTFRSKQNKKYTPVDTAFASDVLYRDLLKGNTASFNEAVDGAKKECLLAINGDIKFLQLYADYDMLPDNATATVKATLANGLEVVQYYSALAEQLIEKLKKSEATASTMTAIYKKLHELEEIPSELEVEDHKIRVPMPETLRQYRKHWAAEEKTLREEATRKRAEARLQAEKAKREKEENERQEAQKKQDGEIAALKERLKAEYDEGLALAQKTFDEAMQKAETLKCKLKAEQKSLSDQLQMLGFFNFGAKSRIKARLAAIETELTDNERTPAILRATLNKQEKELRDEHDRKLALGTDAIESRYAVPAHNPAPHQVNNEDIKQIIYSSMQRGKLYTIEEMIDTFPLPADISNQKVTALTRQLVLEEKVEKIVQNRISYFKLNDSTPAGKPNPRYAVPTHNPAPHKVKNIEHDRKTALDADTTSLQQQRTEDSIKAIILENMRPGQRYTISQMQETFPFPANTSAQQVTAGVRALLLAELVERISERRISYFKLNDSTLAGIPDPRYVVPTHNPVPHQVDENENIQQIIYNSMQRGKLYTIEEMIDTFPLPADISNQKVTALTRQLCLAEKVEKIVQNRRSYFRKP